MEVAGDGHVAPSLHSQEDDLRAVDQPPFGRAGAAEVLKGGALLGGQRDDNRGRRTLSTNTDGYVHGSYDLCCNVCCDEFGTENTCP
jgi:hypothetical protein